MKEPEHFPPPAQMQKELHTARSQARIQAAKLKNQLERFERLNQQYLALQQENSRLKAENELLSEENARLWEEMEDLVCDYEPLNKSA